MAEHRVQQVLRPILFAERGQFSEPHWGHPHAQGVLEPLQGRQEDREEDCEVVEEEKES